MVEIQAYGTSAGGEKVQWLVPDHLGTPRIVVDETGNRANVKRHDYLPFGEELFAGTGGRTTALGYTADGVRQQFTSYERDNESDLDFAQARYYSSSQGRFTSVDPLMASAVVTNPQTLNRYSYVTNSPLTLTDPSGMFAISPESSELGGIGSLAGSFNSQNVDKAEQQQQPQNNPKSLQTHVDNTCSLLVEFTGPGYMTTNGPGESIDDGVYGFGFTVSGWVADGAIGKVERSDPDTGVPETDIVNPNGN
jgi:RHS repeat-associated protein